MSAAPDNSQDDAARHLVVTYDGYLTEAAVAGSFRELRARLSEEGGQAVGLVVDCRRMNGYEKEARERFVSENAAVRDNIIGVAVVTDNGMYRMVVGAMGLASAQKMKAFATVPEALVWLATFESEDDPTDAD